MFSWNWRFFFVERQIINFEALLLLLQWKNLFFSCWMKLMSISECFKGNRKKRKKYKKWLDVSIHSITCKKKRTNFVWSIWILRGSCKTFHMVSNGHLHFNHSTALTNWKYSDAQLEPFWFSRIDVISIDADSFDCLKLKREHANIQLFASFFPAKIL
jgi:hypothetical protein